MDNNSGVKSSHAMMDGVERGTPLQNHHNNKYSKGSRACDVVLRVGALLLTLAAAVVMGVDKQTKTVPVQISAALPPLNVPVSAKWHYLSAFVFFVVANAIACSYALFSIVTALVAGKKGTASALTMIVDLLMVALLFAGNGAAAAVGLLGKNGNSHVRWNKVCDVFGRFCNQVLASIGLSLVGSLLFVLLVLFAVVRLHRNSS